MTASDVVITGIGIVTSLGEGIEANWTALATPGTQPVLDAARFAPYTVHPLPEIDWSQQIAKRGDQRQMETWQRLGTYVAGLALDDAGLKGDEALCASMDMIVAAAGGERDEAVDQAILDAGRTRTDRGLLLNEKLTTELRPTLFLAQLSNLLAGNISIVHKVTGSSRTFMGEEGSAISAIETGVARIRAGRSTHMLVGGAFQTEHANMLLGYELGGTLHRGEWSPVWSRDQEGGGVVTGSGAVFLVLESRRHAEARGRAPYASIAEVRSARHRRDAPGHAEALEALFRQASAGHTGLTAISGASGAPAPTAAERDALARAGHAARGFSTLTGHMKEAQFPFAIALAALSIARGAPLPAFDASEPEAPEGAPQAVLATTVGFNRFEGAALVTSLDHGA